MLCNRLVKYESSIGGVNLKAILSDNDGKSSCNLLRLPSSNLTDNRRSPTAVSLVFPGWEKRSKFVVRDKSDSMLAASRHAKPEFETQLMKASAILSPSITLNPFEVDSISKHRSPSPSSAAPTSIPGSHIGNWLIK